MLDKIRSYLKYGLFNERGLLRAPLRFVVGLKIIPLIVVGTSFLFVPLNNLLAQAVGQDPALVIGSGVRQEYTPLRAITGSVVGFIGYPLAMYGVMKYVERQPLKEIGVSLTSNFAKDTFKGGLLGIAAALLTLTMLITAGLAEVSVSADTVSASVIGGVIALAFVGFSTALKGSLLYIGYTYHVTAKVANEYMSTKTAAIVTIVFVSLVSSIDGQSFGAFSNLPALFVFAVYSGVAVILRMRTGSIAVPLGFVSGWNLIRVPIFGATSGASVDKGSILVTEFVGNPIWTGGEVGIQGSVVGLLTYMTLLLLVYDFSVRETGQFDVNLSAFTKANVAHREIPSADYVRFRFGDTLLFTGLAVSGFSFGLWFSSRTFAGRAGAVPGLALAGPLLIFALVQYLEPDIKRRVIALVGLLVTLAGFSIAAMNYPDSFNTIDTLWFTRGMISIYLIGLLPSVALVISRIRTQVTE